MSSQYRCQHCDFTGDSENMMRTHVLLRHRDKIEDSTQFESLVSDGHLNTESRHEKGEQFGYR